MARFAAIFLAIFGLLPIANWIAGGHQAPWYGDRLTLWISGTAIVGGLVVIIRIALKRYPQLWPAGRWDQVAAFWERNGRRADLTIAAVALGCYALISQLVLSAKPLLIDEIVQLFQARILASGHLWLPAATHPEFTGAMHIIDMSGKVYGQFPIGGPAMLMLGVLVGAAWLVGPVFAAAGVFCFGRLLRLVEVNRGTALAAVLLYAFAPFVAIMSGSMMNHVTTLAWLIAAALALAHTVGDQRPKLLLGFLVGLCLGIAATIRPIDAVAFALPTAGWLLIRTWQDRRQVAPLLLSGLGVALPIAGLLLVNAAWTGHPLRFGYIELWGHTHALGFHEAPWGFAHTPTRGLELINLYLLELQRYLFETPVPALLFATGALALIPRLKAFDRWVLCGSGLLLLGYFAYWHNGFYLGPRFLLPLAPWLALWTARFPEMLRLRGLAMSTQRAILAGGVLALLIGAVQLLPIRLTQYHNGMLSMRLDPVAAARSEGIHDAVILARETWGAQLIARMWGLGVSRTDAERIYRTTDACTLDSLLGHAEATREPAPQLLTDLAPFRADSSKLVKSGLSPDTTLRAIPGATWGTRCVRRILEDRSGSTVFAPLLLAHGDGNIWIRDLHGLDSLLLDSLQHRQWWLLVQAPQPGSPLRFERIDRDSMQQEWGSGGP